MNSLLKEFPNRDEEGRRYWSTCDDMHRVYLSNYRLVRSLKGNWESFWEMYVDSGEITLSDVPFPLANKIVYGCYSYFTDTPADKTYTRNEGTYILDPTGDFLVYETRIERNSTWSDIILASDALIVRVNDWQHNCVDRHTPCNWSESPDTTIEFLMCS